MPPLAASAPLLLRPTLDRFKAPGQGRAFVYCPGRAPNDDASTRCVRRQGVHAVCSEAAAVECQHACDIVILSLGLQNALAAAGCLLQAAWWRAAASRRPFPSSLAPVCALWVQRGTQHLAEHRADGGD